MVQWDGHTVLIDTTPDFREQAIREHISKSMRCSTRPRATPTTSSASMTCGRFDFPRADWRKARSAVRHRDMHGHQVLRHVFRYIFEGDYRTAVLAQVELAWHRRGPGFEIGGGASFIPLTVNHGDYPDRGLSRFGSAAYLTDFSSVPEETMRQLEGLDILFLDALRHHPHPTHSSVEQSLKIVEQLKPKRAFFTHISHDLPHEETNASLPANVRLSHDGLKLEFEL